MTSEFGLHETFDHHFLSYEIGLMKPGQEIFKHVLEAIGHAPERILYFDDNRINVDAARKAGIHAWRVKGMNDTRSSLLESHKLL